METDQGTTAPALTRIFNTPEGNVWVEFEQPQPDLPTGRQVTISWQKDGRPKRYTGIVQMKTTEIVTFGGPTVFKGRLIETVYLDANRFAILGNHEGVK